MHSLLASVRNLSTVPSRATKVGGEPESGKKLLYWFFSLLFSPKVIRGSNNMHVLHLLHYGISACKEGSADLMNIHLQIGVGWAQ